MAKEGKSEKREAKRMAKEAKRAAKRKAYGKPSLAFSGCVTGAVLGGMSQVMYTSDRSYVGLVIGAVAGLVVCLALGYFVAKYSESVRMRVQYAVCGLLPGYMVIGNPFVIRQKWGAAVGAMAFAVVFGFLISPLVNRMRKQGRYLSFPGEGGLFTVFALIMSYAGDEIAQLIIHRPYFYNPHPVVSTKLHKIITVMIPKSGTEFVVTKALIGSLVPTLLILLAFLWIGFALAANRRRPVFGATLTIIGGAMVSYIGFKVAPMLFEPGSGLLWAGLVVGLFMIAMAITAIYYAQMRVPLGVVIIVLSVLSFLGAAGGLIVGGILGIFGGAMIAAWQDPNEVHAKPDLPASPIPPSQNLSI